MKQPCATDIALPRRLELRLIGLPRLRLIVLGLLMLFVATLPAAVALSFTPDYEVGGAGFSKQNIFRMIIWGCLLAPLLETAIHQWACLRLLERFRVAAPNAILVSSLVFGAAHYYSYLYVMTAFFCGVVLATVFMVERKKNGAPF
ncbi:CPBP family intramembrane metalloprotease [Caballeronia sp. EK]|uniref:CPBP family intramembrane glutamic endopeptidase n=1 Tax=Caballeronia sp. EK TaxID=2767469 RepID=UPI001655E4BE|nr:CPBP family intramembrane glutamic endopeptidase [Caballeronia sp. EK]MBC8637772.1 CPBP family intramembrane metalloprotease [Caballeronia sp. EK]